MSETVNLKCLSLWQPWAQAIALDLKHWETRGWATSYRGPLGIHASKRPFGVQSFGFEFHSLVARQFDEKGFAMDALDYGKLLCVVDLVDCVPAPVARSRLSAREQFWGDYRERGDDGRRRYAFRLENLRVIPCWKRPTVAGRQGFFDVGIDGSLFAASEKPADAQAQLFGSDKI